MKLKSQPASPTDIQSLSNMHQVALAVDSTSGDSALRSILPRQAHVADICVRLGLPVPVEVDRQQDQVFVRGNLDKLAWKPVEPVAAGLRKVIASNLGVDPEELVFNKLLVVDAMEAHQSFEIRFPASHEEALNRAESQDAVDTYLEVLRGENPPTGATSIQVDASSSNPSEGSADIGGSHDLASAARAYAMEVREAVGGKTLPAMCSIEVPGWQKPLSLVGKLGEKPPKSSTSPKDLEIVAHIDGYLKSQRVVHLLPTANGESGSTDANGKGRKVMAFDEEKWFGEIAALAAKRGQLVRVKYSQVTNGGKELLRLISIEPITQAVRLAA